MNYTDLNIPITCGECWPTHIEEGVQAMFEHILEFHPQYNQHEADVYALKWAEQAYDEIDLKEQELTRKWNHG